MHADTDAIRTLAIASTSHADELGAIASTLTSVPAAAAASAFGPVGAPYMAAFVEAVAHEIRAVTALGDRASAAASAASGSATAYDDADARAGARISGV
jgi:Excreted virulence factor EspC, type VII ESX diderm